MPRKLHREPRWGCRLHALRKVLLDDAVFQALVAHEHCTPIDCECIADLWQYIFQSFKLTIYLDTKSLKRTLGRVSALAAVSYTHLTLPTT